MSNRLSRIGAQSMLTGAFSWIDDTTYPYKVLAVDTSYTFNVAHDNLDDVAAGSRIGQVALLYRTAVAGVADAVDVTIPSAAGRAFKGLWIYYDAGVEASDMLLYWMDQSADGTPLAGTTTVDGIQVQWSPSGILTVT